MKLIHGFVVAFAVLFPAFAAAEDIFTDPTVVRAAWDLLKKGGYGTRDQEHAAFVVRGTEGLTIILWPHGSEFQRATYVGTIPADLVAVVHTHPNALPLPSDADTALALRLGVPVYVLTRSAISRTAGRRNEYVRTGDWNPAVPER